MQEVQCGYSLDVFWVGRKRISRKKCVSQIIKGFACNGKLDFIQSYKAGIKA